MPNELPKQKHIHQHIDVRKRRISVFLVCTTALLDLLGYSMGAVVAPGLVRQVQGEPKSCCPKKPSTCKPPTIYHPDRSPTEEYYPWEDSEAPTSCTEKRKKRIANIGLPSTVYGVGSIISSFWLPKYSDKYGRKRAFILSLIGSSFGFLGFALAKDLWMMLGVRFAAGLLGASFVVTNAYIFDVYGPVEGPVVMTKLNALYMAGLVVAPVMATLLVMMSDEIRTPLYVGAALSFCCLFFSIFYMVEPKNLITSDKAVETSCGVKNPSCAREEGSTTVSLPETAERSHQEVSIIYHESSEVEMTNHHEEMLHKVHAWSALSPKSKEEKNALQWELVSPNQPGVVFLSDQNHNQLESNLDDVEGDVEVDTVITSSSTQAHTKGHVNKDKKKKSKSPWKSTFNLAIGMHRFLLFVPVYGYYALQAVLLMEARYDVIDREDSIDDQGKDIAVQIGYNSAIASICSIPVIYFFLHRIIKAFGLMEIGALSGFVFGAVLFIMPYTWNLWSLMALFVLVGLTMGIFNNLMYLAIATRAPPDRMAQSLAVPIIFDAVAQVVGPFLVILYLYGLVVPFIVSAILAWIGSFLLIFTMSNSSVVESKKQGNSEKSGHLESNPTDKDVAPSLVIGSLSTEADPYQFIPSQVPNEGGDKMVKISAESNMAVESEEEVDCEPFGMSLDMAVEQSLERAISVDFSV